MTCTVPAEESPPTGPIRGQGSQGSIFPKISDDGQVIAFQSQHPFVGTDLGLDMDVFVHDVATGLTTRISDEGDGTAAAYGGSSTRLSANGRHVAFTAEAYIDGGEDVEGEFTSFAMVHDRQTGITTRVSEAIGGGRPNSHSSAAAISDDGRYVLFTSRATNLVPEPRRNKGRSTCATWSAVTSRRSRPVRGASSATLT